MIFIFITGSDNGRQDDSDSYSLSTSEMNESVLEYMMVIDCLHLDYGLNQYARGRIADSIR